MAQGGDGVESLWSGMVVLLRPCWRVACGSLEGLLHIFIKASLKALLWHQRHAYFKLLTHLCVLL